MPRDEAEHLLNTCYNEEQPTIQAAEKLASKLAHLDQDTYVIVEVCGIVNPGQ